MTYPTDLPTLTNPLASDPRVGHATLHGTVNDTIEALAAKLGTGDDNPTNVGDVLTVTGSGASAWQTPTGGGLTSATVTLSSANILDLHNTPITVVAAPGAGKFLLLHRVLCQYSYGTAAYVNGDGPPRLTLGAVLYLTIGGLIDQTTDFTRSLAPPDYDGSADPANLALTVDDGGAAHTTGDGTLTVTVWYSTEDVP